MSTATLSNNLGPSSWFDAFRDNGGPVLYSSMNRTPVVEDIRNILIYIFFTTFFVAFLIIFPGIRKERCSTFICVTTSLFIGAVILISNCGSNWHVSKGSIASPYRAFSKEKIYANVGVHIGLDSVNITLRALPIHERSEDINYNERFYWIGANQMKQEFQRALAKGLPYPILTISEYLSIDGEGFNWGRHYRIAGYYTSITLWLAFASWILMNILLCAVPRYGAYTMQLTGALMLLSNLLYVMMIPTKPLRIPFEGSTLTFTYGWCFWLVFSAGLTAVFIGATVSIVDILFPNKFSTILEVDYDTPYRYFVGNDIHIIGSLPPPLNAYYYHHQHQSSLSTADSRQSSNHHLYQKKKSTKIIRHYSASKTASVSTDSSCCPASTTMTHRILAKTRSDASTSTREDSIIISDSIEQHQQQLPNHYTNENNSELAANLDDMEKIDSLNHDDNPVILVSNYSQDSVQRTSQLINHHHHHHHQNRPQQPPNYESTFDDDDEDDDDDGSGKQYAFENQAYQVDEPQVDDHNNGGDADGDDNLVQSTNHLFIDELANTKAMKLTKKESIIIQNQQNDVVMHHNTNNNNQNEDDYVLASTPTPLVRQSSSSSAMEATTDDEQDDAIESDVSTTIIDGKRAISLSNFGKFAEHREKHGNGNGMMMMGATFGHPMASAGFRAIKNGFSKRVQKHHPHTQQPQQQQLQHQNRGMGGRRSRKQDPSSSSSASSSSSSMSSSLKQPQNNNNKLMISNTSFSVGGGNGVNSSFQTSSSLSSPLASTSSSSSLPSASSSPAITTTTTTTSSSSSSSATAAASAAAMASKKSLSSSVRVDLSSSAAMW